MNLELPVLGDQKTANVKNFQTRMDKSQMSGATSFFRVFDLAFFGPGVVVLMSIKMSGLIEVPDSMLSWRIDQLGSLLSIIIAIGCAYVTGLTLHAIREFLAQRIEHLFMQNKGSKKTSWYERVSNELVMEIVHYFWYMRATCWNLATSCVIVGVISLISWTVWMAWALAFCIPLVYLGYRFDGALKRATSSTSVLK